MNIFIITLLSFISFMIYFFVAVGAYRLYDKIHPPYYEGNWHWHTDDIKSWNFIWAFFWPITLPVALIYVVFNTKLVESIFVKCGEGIDFFFQNIVGGFLVNTYKFYNKIFDKIFRGTI